MSFSLKMFDSKMNVAVVESGGVGSIVPHSHDFVETVCVTGGRGEHVIGDRHVKIEKGNLFVIADKSVKINENRSLMGHSTYPLAIDKDSIV